MSTTVPARLTPPAYAPHAQAAFELHILDGQERILVQHDYMRLVTGVDLELTWDGAAQLSVDFRAWDERTADYVVMGERIFAPGTSLLFRAGYGGRVTTIGRFDVVRHEGGYPSGSHPTLRVVAVDGFARFMQNTYPGHYGTPATYDDVALAVARQHGMGFAGDVSKPVDHKVRRVRQRRGRTAAGKATYRATVVPTVFAKQAGETDAAMLKRMANMSGFGLPEVRYIERQDVATYQALYPRTSRLGAGDALLFRRLSFDRQRLDSARFRFDYRGVEGRPASLASFDADWSANNVPLAVRLTGIDPELKALWTVEAEWVVDPVTGAGQRIEVNSEIQNLNQKVHLRGASKRTKRDIQKAIRRARQGEDVQLAATLDILGEYTPMEVYDPISKGKVQTMKREVIRGMQMVVTREQAEAVVKGWLRARMDTHMTGRGTLENVPGSELIRPNHVYEHAGLASEHTGFYMIRTARHSWAPDGRHTVDVASQKVGQVPAGVAIKGRSKTETPPA